MLFDKMEAALVKRKDKFLRKTSKENRRKNRRNIVLAWVTLMALMVPLFNISSAYAVETSGNEMPAASTEPDEPENADGENVSEDEGVSDVPASDEETITFTEEELESGLCPHHPMHTEECGYKAPEGGSPCMHVHDENCGYRESEKNEEPAEPVVSEGSPCNHVHDENCGYQAPGEIIEPAEPETPSESGEADGSEGSESEEKPTEPMVSEGSPCNHVHDESCGYQAPGEVIEPEEPSDSGNEEDVDKPDDSDKPDVGSPCNHVHDENCGYQEPQGEGSPCLFECPFCIINWQWIDEDEMLVFSEETGQWGLGLPGASEEQPVTREVLEEMLPMAIDAETEAGHSEVEVIWNFDEFPEEGIYEGMYLLAADLAEAMDGEAYVLTKEAPALEVLLAVGEGELYVDYPKYLNQWSFIAQDGSKLLENNIAIDIKNLNNKNNDQIIQWLKSTVLPTKIRGWVSASDNNGVFTRVGFTFDGDQSERKFETTATDPVERPSNAYQWGRVGIEWDDSYFPSNFDEGVEFTLYAKIPIVTDINNGKTYTIYVNSNDPEDHRDVGKKDTSTNPYILGFNVTIINLEDHIVSPANPENVTVNLFDYWVKEQDPTVNTNGDILNKSDSHKHELNDTGTVTDIPTGYSAKDDWNIGINKNHLLLFGDGLIHAGLWNKGAGGNCRYGKAYAGMEGIVKNVLPENGYPELNLKMAKSILTGDDSRDYKLIKDYNLTGDHDFNQGNAYTSTDIQNLSNTVIGTWGGNIDSGTESLQYLFDLTDGYSKRFYSDVKGLFQLDNDGYYYYNMRENFAEFKEETDNNHFILYDAPATVRTDGDQSIGNFFPFNKGYEVFNGVKNGADGEELTSSVACSGNTMNHHLGMTVNVAFRQPVDGKITSGSNGKPMTFEFAGDDDVWVFIDDVLVLDLGGIHSELYGTIDFSTGKVCIGRAFDTKGIPENPADKNVVVTETDLKTLFDKANKKGKDSDWRGNTFASNTSHTLKMFYLERGNYDSSIALRFNLQPLLPQQIEKVDQNGNPVSGVKFELYQAELTNDAAGAIQCFYTDDQVQSGESFYVKQKEGEAPLVTLTTGQDGVGMFELGDGSYFNFADRGEQYYILKEITAPSGYRSQPVDIVLHFDPNTSMLSVANRWTTGAYACSVSNVIGPIVLNGGETTSNFDSLISPDEQKDGLVVAIPMLLKKSTGNSWMALYGSNLGGFNSVEVSGGDWKEAVLTAALNQAKGGSYASWHLDWDAGNNRLSGRLSDLPGLASRYRLNNPNGDMQMVYGLISSDALKAVGISADNAKDRYEKLQNYSIETACREILNTPNGFRFLNVGQFNRTFRSLIYIPNERRELWVQKVDQNGNPRAGAIFGVYRGNDPGCTGTPAATGTTDGNGMLVFSPTAQGVDGQANIIWADSAPGSKYYLREISAPPGCNRNDTIVPIVVGYYSIYADAGDGDNGVSVMAEVGRLTQTMRQYAMEDNVDITLRDITAFMQVQPKDSFDLFGWKDVKLDGTEIVRSMNLHFGKNEQVDYGLHDEDGGKIYKPYFVTDTGFIRTRVRQNYEALTGNQYTGEGSQTDANKDYLGDADLTNLFSLVNIVVVTDQTDPDTDTGKLTISKMLTGNGLIASDYTKNFKFTLQLEKDGNPLDGRFEYYFYGKDKAGYLSNGEEFILHHDESITILGLPVGTKFTVKEIDADGWFVTPDTGEYTGTITKENVFIAAFENSKDPNARPTPTPKPSSTPGPSSPTVTPTPENPGNPGNPDTPGRSGDLGNGNDPEQRSARPNAPDTGDSGNIELWILLGGLSFLALAIIWAVKLRRKRE